MKLFETNSAALKFCQNCSSLLRTVLEFTIRCRVSKKLFEQLSQWQGHQEQLKNEYLSSPTEFHEKFESHDDEFESHDLLEFEDRFESQEPEKQHVQPEVVISLKSGLRPRLRTPIMKTKSVKSKTNKNQKPNCNSVVQRSLKNLQDYFLGESLFCNVCCLHFSSHIFVDHVISQHSTKQDDRYQCKYCSVVISGGSHAFARHFIDHKGFEGAKKCLKCQKEFSTVAEMEQHIKEHTRVKFKIPYFTCHHCGKELRDKNRLRCHIINKHMTSGMLCKFRVCGAWFLQEVDLRKHEASHALLIERSGPPSITCNVCNIRVPKKNQDEYCEQ